MAPTPTMQNIELFFTKCCANRIVSEGTLMKCNESKSGKVLSEGSQLLFYFGYVDTKGTCNVNNQNEIP